MTFDPDFKVTRHFSTLNISETTRESHILYYINGKSYMRSVEWWYFQWPWWTPKPVFKVTAFWSQISQKTVHFTLGTKLLKNTNRKPYTIYRMVSPSMTLRDSWPRFQGQDIFEVDWISEKRRVLDKGTVALEETIPNIWNATVWWPWLTSKRVAWVYQHQLQSFLYLHALLCCKCLYKGCTVYVDSACLGL